jgi:hypothetical protein
MKIHKHTWIWDNFGPIPPNLTRNNQFYRLRKFFINKKNPLLVFTGTGTDLIYNEDTTLDYYIFSRLSTAQLEPLRNNEIHVYFYEPLTFWFTPELRKKLVDPTTINNACRYGFFEEFDLDTKMSDMTIIELDHLQDLATKYNVNFKVYGCDYNLSTIVSKDYGHLYPNISYECFDIFIRDTNPRPNHIEHTYPVLHPSQDEGPPVYVPGYKETIDYKICSLNLRYATHRHLVAAHLSDKDAYLTWPYKIDSTCSIHNFSWIDKKILDCDLYDHLSHYNLSGKILNLLTYRNTVDVKVTVKNIYSPQSILQDYIGYENEDLVKIVHHSFLYVVTESRYCQPIANISEKLLRSYLAKRPFVIVGAPYSLEYLNKLGFKSFNKWWDESYDTEENHSKRLKMIFDIIDYIDSLSYDDLWSLLNEMKDVLDHNYEANKCLFSNKIILQ